MTYQQDDSKNAKPRFNLTRMPHASIQARIHEKAVLVLKFLAVEPYSTARILSHVLKLGNRQTQATLADMAKKKLIQLEVLPDGNRVYGITSNGLASINCVSGKRFESGKISLAYVPHTLLTQKVGIDLVHYGATGWMNERELQKNKYFFARMPDGAFWCRDFGHSAEIELNIQSAKRAKVVFKNIVKDIEGTDESASMLDYVIYFTPFPSAIKNFINQYVPENLRKRFYVHRIELTIPFFEEQPDFVPDADLYKFLTGMTYIKWA